MMLKNRMTRHESRNPSPKVAGPNVPAENLSSRSPVTGQTSSSIRGRVDGREDVKVRRKPDKKYLAVLRVRSRFRWNREDA